MLSFHQTESRQFAMPFYTCLDVLALTELTLFLPFIVDVVDIFFKIPIWPCLLENQLIISLCLLKSIFWQVQIFLCLEYSWNLPNPLSHSILCVILFRTFIRTKLCNFDLCWDLWVHFSIRLSIVISVLLPFISMDGNFFYRTVVNILYLW
jgi:hypothetical protein